VVVGGSVVVVVGGSVVVVVGGSVVVVVGGSVVVVVGGSVVVVVGGSVVVVSGGGLVVVVSGGGFVVVVVVPGGRGFFGGFGVPEVVGVEVEVGPGPEPDFVVVVVMGATNGLVMVNGVVATFGAGVVLARFLVVVVGVWLTAAVVGGVVAGGTRTGSCVVVEVVVLPVFVPLGFDCTGASFVAGPAANGDAACRCDTK
jgi:hypothetical protein